MDGPLKLAQFVVGSATVEAGIGIQGIEADGRVMVLNGPLKLARFMVDGAMVAVTYGFSLLGLRLSPSPAMPLIDSTPPLNPIIA